MIYSSSTFLPKHIYEHDVDYKSIFQTQIYKGNEQNLTNGESSYYRKINWSRDPSVASFFLLR